MPTGFSRDPTGPAAGPQWLGGNLATFVDGPLADVWSVLTTTSRSVPDYAAPRSTTSLVASTVISPDWAPEPTSRMNINYAPKTSYVGNVLGTTSTDSLPLSSNQTPPKPYAPPRSFVGNVYDSPSVAGGTEYVAPVSSNLPPKLPKPPSISTLFPDTPAVTFGTEYAPQSQSTLIIRPARTVEYATLVVDNPTIDQAPAPQSQSRSVSSYSPVRSSSVSLFVDPVFGTAFALPTIYSPRVYPNPWRPSFTSFPWAVGTLLDAIPGGGGFGAVMSAEFLGRYDPRYKPHYDAEYAERYAAHSSETYDAGYAPDPNDPNYKPTIRKQKKG